MHISTHTHTNMSQRAPTCPNVPRLQPHACTRQELLVEREQLVQALGASPRELHDGARHEAGRRESFDASVRQAHAHEAGGGRRESLLDRIGRNIGSPAGQMSSIW